MYQETRFNSIYGMSFEENELFLYSYFSSMFNQLLDIDLETVIRDNSITIYIPKVRESE